MMSTDLHHGDHVGGECRSDPVRNRSPRLARATPTASSVASHGVLIVWSIIVIAPLLWTLLSSFKTSAEIFSSPFSLPADWNLDNFRTAWTQEGFGNYFLNTIVIVGSALVIVMTLGSMCAYVLARFQFPGNRLIYYLMLAGLTFPVFLAIVPLFQLMQQPPPAQPATRARRRVRRVRPAVHRLLPLSLLQAAAQRDLRGRRRGWRRRVADVLPGDVADGQAGHGLGGDLQLPRLVEPVPATRGPQHRPGQLRAVPGHAVASPRRPATPSTSARSSPP